LEEKIKIAQELLDVLGLDIIAKKTGLTVEILEELKKKKR
jgi:hypothetical protein